LILMYSPKDPSLSVRKKHTFTSINSKGYWLFKQPQKSQRKTNRIFYSRYFFLPHSIQK
jgi:hypothetical protein